VNTNFFKKYIYIYLYNNIRKIDDITVVVAYVSSADETDLEIKN